MSVGDTIMASVILGSGRAVVEGVIQVFAGTLLKIQTKNKGYFYINKSDVIV